MNNTCNLAELENGLPGVTTALGQFLSEASAVCFHKQNHQPGVELEIDGTIPCSFNVYWNRQITPQVLRAWNDEQELTEFGACGVAILIILELTDYTVIRRARKGTGIDYWLGHAGSGELFQDAARLEVSGILKGDDQAIKTRVQRKIRQTEQSEGDFPAYIVIVEFSRPKSYVVEK